jgi:hypothetical protein
VICPARIRDVAREVILDSSNPKNGERSETLKLILTPEVLGRSIS